MCISLPCDIFSHFMPLCTWQKHAVKHFRHKHTFKHFRHKHAVKHFRHKHAVKHFRHKHTFKHFRHKYAVEHLVKHFMMRQTCPLFHVLAQTISPLRNVHTHSRFSESLHPSTLSSLCRKIWNKRGPSQTVWNTCVCVYVIQCEALVSGPKLYVIHVCVCVCYTMWSSCFGPKLYGIHVCVCVCYTMWSSLLRNKMTMEGSCLRYTLRKVRHPRCHCVILRFPQLLTP